MVSGVDVGDSRLSVGKRARASWPPCLMKMLVTVSAAILLSGGCVGADWQRGTWVKPGVEPEQQRRDQYECERYAVTNAVDERRAALYAECMRTRGYEPERFERPVRPRLERVPPRD